jgi:hypothetical protein
MDNLFSPFTVVQRIPCFSFASANTRSIVSLRFARISLWQLPSYGLNDFAEQAGLGQPFLIDLVGLGCFLKA